MLDNFDDELDIIPVFFIFQNQIVYMRLIVVNQRTDSQEVIMHPRLRSRH